MEPIHQFFVSGDKRIPSSLYPVEVSLLQLHPMGSRSHEALTGTSEIKPLTWQETPLRL